MPEDLSYPDSRERIRRRYEASGELCRREELQNTCYFIAVLAHGTAATAVANFPVLKQAVVWTLLQEVRETHAEDIRRVRAIRDHLRREAQQRGLTPHAASHAATRALYRDFFHLPYPAEPSSPESRMSGLEPFVDPDQTDTDRHA